LVTFAPIWTNPVGVQNLNAIENFTLSPNPCTQYFEIEALSEAKVFYEIYNKNGVLIKKGELKGGKRVINTSNWAKGSYFIKTYSDQSVNTKKLLIQ